MYGGSDNSTGDPDARPQQEMGMMNRLRKSLWVAALAVVLGTASSAQASLELVLTSGASTVTKSDPNSGGSVNYSGAVGNFSVVFAYGDSNSPGGQTALTEEGSIKITNNSSSAETITIVVSAQDFTSPHSPPAMDVLDTVSGTVATGSLISGSAQGFADASNTLFGTGFASTKLTFGPNGPSTSFSQNGDVNGFMGSKYSLTFTETFTVAGGTSLTLTGGNVQTVVPAPAGLVLALTGFPMLGFAGLLRRRRKLA